MTDNPETPYVLPRKFYGPQTPLQSLKLSFRTVDRVAVPRKNAAMRR